MKRKLICAMLSLCMLTSMTSITSAASIASGNTSISDNDSKSDSMNFPDNRSDNSNSSNNNGSDNSDNSNNNGFDNSDNPNNNGSDNSDNSNNDSSDNLNNSSNNLDNSNKSNGNGSDNSDNPNNNSDNPDSSTNNDSDNPNDSDPDEPELPEVPEPTAPPVFDFTPDTNKISSKAIKISWSSAYDDLVKRYFVMRRTTENNMGTGKWKTIAKIPSDGIKGGPENSYTNRLSSSSAQQYEYKICILSNDKVDTRDSDYVDETDEYAILGTNIKICIDPGHYGTMNNNYECVGKDGKFRYSEAKFTLKIGKALQKELKQTYGINSFMTRTSDSISLTYNGSEYINENLDGKNIAVRGYSAKTADCDLFLSLHTNSTSRPTRPWSQPKSLNKVFVFVNSAANKSNRGMKIANAIGINLTEYNKETGIQTSGFTTRNKNMAIDFSNLGNDSAGNGTVIHRKSSRGDDYYGVLRGSSSVGVEGILVEHAFHCTQIVRKLAAASSDLYKNWAACDAYGVAYGFGFLDSQNMTLQP